MDSRPTRIRARRADGPVRRVTLTATADGWIESPWGRHHREAERRAHGRAGELVRHAEVERVDVGGTERDVRVTVWTADGEVRRYRGGLSLLTLAQAALDAA